MDGKWVRLPKDGGGVVIFVHGILSSGEACWKHSNGAYWPTLLSEEQALSDLGIYVYTYQTSIASGYYSVGDVVGDLKERLKNAQTSNGTIWQRAGAMIFVCHSMGGIVARKLIVRNQMELIELGARIGLFLVASPSLGSSYANWVAMIARAAGHTQAIALKFGQDNQWLNELDSEFQTLKESARIPIVGRELQEDKFIVRRLFGLLPQIVQPLSAHRYFGDPLKISHSDHFSISKPADATAIAHQALVRFLREDCQRLAPSKPAPEPPAEVVEPADDWPEEGGAAFVCVTERGSAVQTVKSFDEYCAAFGSPLPVEQSYSGFAVRGFFENGGAFAVISRAVGQGACRAQVSIQLSPAGQALVLSARDVGAYGNRLQVRISAATRKGLRIVICERESPLEDFDNVPIDGGGTPALMLAEYINRNSQWIAASVLNESSAHADATLPASGTWNLQGGADGVLTAESFLGGLAGLKNSWHCGLVCIPDVIRSSLQAEERERITAALLAHCAAEQAIAVLAAATSNDELLQVRAPCDSAFAIATWPWLSVLSCDGKQAVVVPPDGHVAGAIARSEKRQGLHKHPTLRALAGTLRTIPSIEGSGEQRAEYALEADRRGFNLLAMVDGKPHAFLRPLITTALAEADKDPSRSRLLMFIYRRVRDGLAWVMFEPRGEEVKRSIIQEVEEFLHKLWKLGALGGTSPAEAYHVRVEANPSGSGYQLEMGLTLASNYAVHLVCNLPSGDDS
jgi:hypothetical protein